MGTERDISAIARLAAPAVVAIGMVVAYVALRAPVAELPAELAGEPTPTALAARPEPLAVPLVPRPSGLDSSPGVVAAEVAGERGNGAAHSPTPLALAEHTTAARPIGAEVDDGEFRPVLAAAGVRSVDFRNLECRFAYRG